MSYKPELNFAGELVRRELELRLQRALEDAIVEPRVDRYRKQLKELVREETKKITIGMISKVMSPQECIEEYRVYVKTDFEEL